MPINVIKRDGRKEPLDIEKLHKVTRKNQAEIGADIEQLKKLFLKLSIEINIAKNKKLNKFNKTIE